MEVHKIVFSPYAAVLSHNIAQLLPNDLNKCFFPNSGAEANEGALKLAYRYHKGERDYIMHSDIAFHGKLIASGSLASNYPDNQGFQKMPFTYSFRFNDIESVKDGLNILRKNNKSNVYAIIIEPFSASQCVESSSDFLVAVRKLCDLQNIVLIFDEIFTGWGKTGYLFNFFKNKDLYPDILTMSKSFGGGKASISCYVTRDKIYDKAYGSIQDSTKHSSTYTGFGEETITAIEAIRIVIQDNYPACSKKIDLYLTEKLKKIKQKFPNIIQEIRGEGTLKALLLSDQFKFIKNMMNIFPLEKIKNKTSFIGKIVSAAIIDELYSSHNILVEAGVRKIHNKSEDKFESGVFIFISPSCIANTSHIDQFIEGLDKTLSCSTPNLISKFIKGNVEKLINI